MEQVVFAVKHFEEKKILDAFIFMLDIKFKHIRLYFVQKAELLENFGLRLQIQKV
jgi:hypothetical protein